MPSSTTNFKTGWLRSAGCVLLSIFLFFAVGEIYFRLRYFGPDSLWHFKDYLPAGLDNPFCSVQRDNRTATHLKANSDGRMKGCPFNTNALGFRTQDRPFKKDPDTVRILAIGSSITMGSGVGQDETYPSLLEKMLNAAKPSRKVEVINLSMIGYGIDRMTAVLRDYGLRYDPDIILFEGQDYYQGDLYIKNFKSPYTPGQTFTDAACRHPETIFFFWQAVCKRLPRTLPAWMPGKNSTPPAVRPALTDTQIRGYLEEMRDLSRGRKTFIIDLLPLASGVIYAETLDPQVVKKMADEYGFEYVSIDPKKIGPTAADRVLYPGDPHPNRKAHQVIAEAVDAAIEPVL